MRRLINCFNNLVLPVWIIFISSHSVFADELKTFNFTIPDISPSKILKSSEHTDYGTVNTKNIFVSNITGGQNTTLAIGLQRSLTLGTSDD